MYDHVVALFRDGVSSKVNDDANQDGLEAPESRNRVMKSPIFLDLGCCLGQDIRKLILDASPNLPPPKDLVSRIHGADLLPSFIDAGYALFCDERIVPRSQLIAPADVFDTAPDNALSKLDGKVSVLHVGAVFHLFDLEQQKEVGRRCLKLLERKGVEMAASGHGEGGEEVQWSKRALIFGEQVGNITAGHTARQSGGLRYRHNEESWKGMWEELVQEDEWEAVVRSVRVQSNLEGRSMVSKERDKLTEGEGMAGEQEAGPTASEDEMKKFIGKVEEGFRWHVWWVWIDFV